MKKKSLSILMVFLAAGLLCSPRNGNLKEPALDEVLAKNYRSRGGLDKLKAIKALKISGKFIIPARSLELPITIWQKHPNLMRLEITVQEKKIVQAYDGRKAWWIMPFQSKGPREMPQEQAQRFTDQAEFENPLVVFKEKGYSMELVGQEDMEGTQVFKLKMIKAPGKVIHFYLDGKSGIELKSTLTMKVGETDMVTEIIYSDYRPVNGVMMPFSVENKVNGQAQMRMAMDLLEINLAVADAKFSMPAEKKTAPTGVKK